jgi:hypothetical protein
MLHENRCSISLTSLPANTLCEIESVTAMLADLPELTTYESVAADFEKLARELRGRWRNLVERPQLDV